MTLRVQHGGTTAAGFEVAVAPIPAHLKPFIESWTGYREWSPVPVRRLEYPTGRAVVIIEFGAPIAVDSRRHRVGFFAGIDDGATMTEFAAAHAGVQLNLTIHGALAFGARPMHELARQVVSLDEFDLASSLPEQLAEASTWNERFEWVTRALENGSSTGVNSRESPRGPSTESTRVAAASPFTTSRPSSASAANIFTSGSPARSVSRPSATPRCSASHA